MKKFIFIQTCGIFRNEIIVAINSSYEDIMKFAKKEKLRRDFIFGLQDHKEVIEEQYEKAGYVLMNEELRYSAILGLKDFSTTWESISVLLHEIHHLVAMVAVQKGFVPELEAQAFLFESLFRDIRKTLHAEIAKQKASEKKQKKQKKQ